MLFLISPEIVQSHVQLDYPVGGETFFTGESVIIKWSVLISHGENNWDLYFSSNGGGDWEEIELDLESFKTTNTWTVPQLLTENARIRIVQDNAGTNYSDDSGDFIITDTQSSIEINDHNPTVFKLHPNYPNPFNPTTTISYDLSRSSNVELKIYDQLGRLVKTLVNDRQNANHYKVSWDGRDEAGNQVVSGIYVYRLKIDSFSQARKMILLK